MYIHDLSHAREAFDHLATIKWLQFKALKKAGFSRKEAIQILAGTGMHEK